MAREFHRIAKRGAFRDIQLKRGAVVRKRDSRSGSSRGMPRGIILGVAPSSNYSRAYGKEYFVCQISGDYVHVTRKNSAEFIAAGRVKRVPKSCEAALRDYEEKYPQLGRKKRRR